MEPQTSTDNRREVMDAARDSLPDNVVTFVDECQGKDHPESQLISVLHMVQEHYGYLDRERMDAVAQLLQVPTAKVSGVATFYHFFQLNKPGKYEISVCMGTACYVKGADRVAERLREELGIDFGETTSDGQFSLMQTRCLGTCGLAPVLTVNGKVRGNVTPDQVPVLLDECRKSKP